MSRGGNGAAELFGHEKERAVCAAVCRGRGLRAAEIARELGMSRTEVNRILYGSPLLHELCWQDRDYRWHAIVAQTRPHGALREFCGYYATVRDFLALSEDAWLEELRRGCADVGRSLSDKRGLIHSFLDCRCVMAALFGDLRSMLGDECLDWEIAFELRLKRARHVRIYADVLVITAERVFSLEFKMKDVVDPGEVHQAAKYCPYLEILFGPDYEIIPVLVLTAARELFSFSPIDGTNMVLCVCSGDMLFNAFNEYLDFLA